VQTYPNGLPPDARDNPPSETAFAFHVLGSATALTPDEFIALQTQDALQLRQKILQDATASASLHVLAADATNWTNLYLTALVQAGLLRPTDAPGAASAWLRGGNLRGGRRRALLPPRALSRP